MKGDNMPKEQRVEIKLTYESLIAILQGKEFHLYSDGMHIIFRPPFEGVFLTHKQLDKIRYDAQYDAFNMIEQLSKYTEKREGPCQKNKH